MEYSQTGRGQVPRASPPEADMKDDNAAEVGTPDIDRTEAGETTSILMDEVTF
jgi:hypothetical protein